MRYHVFWHKFVRVRGKMLTIFFFRGRKCRQIISSKFCVTFDMDTRRLVPQRNSLCVHQDITLFPHICRAVSLFMGLVFSTSLPVTASPSTNNPWMDLSRGQIAPATYFSPSTISFPLFTSFHQSCVLFHTSKITHYLALDSVL